MTRVSVDGVEVEVAGGATILEAAEQAGSWVPTVCYDERQEPFGACRVCMVGVAGSPKPLPACARSSSASLPDLSLSAWMVDSGSERTGVRHRSSAALLRAASTETFDMRLATVARPGSGVVPCEGDGE